MWVIPTVSLERSSGWCGWVLVTLVVTAASRCLRRGGSCGWGQGTLVQLQSRESLPWELWWESGIAWSCWVPPRGTQGGRSCGSVGARAFGLEPPWAGELSRSRDPAVTRQWLLLAQGGSQCSARSCWAHWSICSWGRAPDGPSLIIPSPSSFLVSGHTSSLLCAVTRGSSVLLHCSGSATLWNPSCMLPLLSWTPGCFNLPVWRDWFRFYCATGAEQKVFKMKCAHPFLPYYSVLTLISRSTTWCPDGCE